MHESPLRAFAPLHMLIVDDDEILADIACDHYRELGFTVEQAANGKQALHLIEQRRPDIVLCDRRMPEMSGAELLEIVRGKGPEWQRMIFVFVTGLSDRRDRYAMMPLNPDAYLCKPLDFEEADFKLAALLRARQSPSTILAAGPSPA
jgi:DNA-binding response OmpR family regulator